MRDRLRTCLLVACLFGLAMLSYGWIIYPELGTVADLTQGAALLTTTAMEARNQRNTKSPIRVLTCLYSWEIDRL
jgi:hypothetical protein